MEQNDSSQPQKDESSNFFIKKAEGGTLPDFMARVGVCKLFHDFSNNDLAPKGAHFHDRNDFIEQYMRVNNETVFRGNGIDSQLVPISSEMFETIMGDYVKTSCGYWPELEWHPVNEKPSTSLYRDVVTGTSGMTREFEKNKSIRQSLTQAEINMIRVTLARAEVRERQNVLDLGCGWGSTAIYALENLTQVKIVAVATTQAQAEYVKKVAQRKKVNDRILVIQCDITQFNSSQYKKQVKEFLGKEKFDRIYSNENFEYVRNWENLLNKLQEEWLETEGKILINFVAHKSNSYIQDQTTWMGKHFLKGKIVPEHSIIKSLDKVIGKSLEPEAEYKVNGRHYSKTAEAWLMLLDSEKARIIKLLEQAYGKEQAKLWFNRWRVYFLMLSEAFRMREGTEWFVSHYLLKRFKPGEKKEEKEKEKENTAEP